MQTNITQNNPSYTGSGTTKRELVNFLVCQRREARFVLRNIEAMVDISMAEARLSKKYRASGNPILIRNAEVIEARIAARKKDIADWNDLLLDIGYCLRAFTEDIDRLIPINDLFDILEVNPADRPKVSAAPSFTEIVFIHGLEDSATHRGSEWKEGPLFKAMARCMDDLMKNNPALQQEMTDSLWGKGGMFEFVPTYSLGSDGKMHRNQPNLRLADEVDLTANPIRH